MKNLLLSLLMLLVSQKVIANQHHHHPDPPSIHGMVLFGEQSTYLSHLPMFHSPHDYQTILKVELDENLKKIYLDSKQGEELFTVVPESFILPELILNPKPFKITIVKGHFERGGTVIGQGVVSITKVLVHKKLSAEEVGPLNYSGILIGDQSEAYYLHSISGRPDFDQISKAELPDFSQHVFNSIGKQGFMILSLYLQSNEEPLEKNKIYSYLPGLPRRAPTSLIIKDIIYLEFGDLSF